MIPGTLPFISSGMSSNYQLILDSSTFTVPSGVTKILVMLTAAGGSGGGPGITYVSNDQGPNISGPGGDGGNGGCAIGTIDVTPGQNITATIGQSPGGGRIPYNTTGYTGGSSSFSTLSATGGLGGITYSGTSYIDRPDSVGSGGNMLNSHSADAYVENTFFPYVLNNWVGNVDTTPLQNMRDQWRDHNYVASTSIVDWSTSSLVYSGVGGYGGRKTANGVYYIYGRGAAHGMALVIWGGII